MAIHFQSAVISCNFSTSSSRLLKFYNNGEEAVQDIPDGSKLLVGGTDVIYWANARKFVDYHLKWILNTFY